MKTKQILLSLLSFVLILSACDKKRELSEDEMKDVRKRTEKWAEALNQGEYKEIKQYYAQQTNFNGQLTRPRQVYKTKEKFFAEHPKYSAMFDAENWTVDSVVTDTIYGHLPVKGKYEGHKEETETSIRLVWKVPLEGDPQIIQQDDVIGKDAKNLMRAYRDANQLDVDFYEDGNPNFKWWAERADSIKGDYDLVPFFARHNKQNFFWVMQDVDADDWDADFNWEMNLRRKDDTYKMGVVRGDGEVVIPADYDIVGNIGGVIPGHFEVWKGELRGLYSTDGKEMLPVEYQAIWPIHKASSKYVALAEKDEKFYGLNSEGSVTELKDSTELSDLGSILADIPWKTYYNIESDQYGPVRLGKLSSWDPRWGIVVTPSFIYDSGLYTRDIMMDESEHTERSHLLQVDSVLVFDDGSVGLFAVFEDWGVGGRESWHDQEHKYELVRPGARLVEKSQTLATVSLEGWRCQIGDVKSLPNGWIEIEENRERNGYWNYTNYKYAQIGDDGKLIPDSSGLEFPATRYAVLDEGYFRGCFGRNASAEEAKAGVPSKEFYEDAANDGAYSAISEHMPFDDLDVMVNEIYAWHGYKFKDQKWQNYFASKPWYTPKHDNVDSLLSEQEKRNTQFIREYQKVNKGREAELVNEKIELDEYY